MSKLGSLKRAGAALHTTGEIGAIPSATRPGVSEPRAALAILAVTVLSDPSARTDRRTGLAPAGGRSLMAVDGAEAVTIDRNARDFKVPDQIESKSRPGSASQSTLCLALLPSPVSRSNPSNAAPTPGASLTLMLTIHHSFWQAPC